MHAPSSPARIVDWLDGVVSDEKLWRCLRSNVLTSGERNGRRQGKAVRALGLRYQRGGGASAGRVRQRKGNLRGSGQAVVAPAVRGPRMGPSRIKRRLFLVGLLFGVPGAVVLDVVWIEPHWLKVKRVRLGRGEPSHRLVHFSDLHYKGDRTFAEKVVGRSTGSRRTSCASAGTSSVTRSRPRSTPGRSADSRRYRSAALRRAGQP